MSITKETRRAAHEDIKPEKQTRRQYILNILRIHGDMTADEIQEVLISDGIIRGYNPNYVRPRLTELQELGEITAKGRRKSRLSGKSMAVWSAKKEPATGGTVTDSCK